MPEVGCQFRHRSRAICAIGASGRSKLARSFTVEARDGYILAGVKSKPVLNGSPCTPASLVCSFIDRLNGFSVALRILNTTAAKKL
jgi:hypothetical protein